MKIALLAGGSGTRLAEETDVRPKPMVDINPNRHSNFMVGTGQPIVAPRDLQHIRPRTVIAMNSIYRDEIAGNSGELGVSTELLAL